MPEKPTYPAGTPSWVDLSSPDLGAAAEFYRGLFGWEASAVPDPAAGGYTMFLLDGRQVGGGAPAQGGMPPMWTTYVGVDDADKTVELARGAGGSVIMEPMDVMGAGRMAVFADPAGAVIAVWQAGEHTGAEVVDEPNTFCWTELSTRDVARSKEFYPAVFGWTVKDNDGEMGTYTEFQVGETSVAGMMAMPPQVPEQVPSHWLPYFAVTDTDATATKAESSGGRVQVPPTDVPPGRFAILTDPFGASFGVIKLARPQA